MFISLWTTSNTWKLYDINVQENNALPQLSSEDGKYRQASNTSIVIHLVGDDQYDAALGSGLYIIDELKIKCKN